MTLTFNYSNGNQVIAGIKIIMTESDGTITILTTDANGQVTLPATSNTYTLSASFTETGEDPISLIDAIQILQYGGELRTLTADQKTAADDNSGHWVSTSNDGNTVAISAEGNDGNGMGSGHVRVFDWVLNPLILQEIVRSR